MGPLGQLVVDDPGHGRHGQARPRRPSIAATSSGPRRSSASMTPRERRDPTVLNGSRRRRIAAGSGTTLPDVNRLVKQFSEMQKLMKQLSGRRQAGRPRGAVRAPVGATGDPTA